MHQIHALQREQVAFGKHAAETSLVDHADMGDAPFGHGDRRVEGRGVGWQTERRRRHYLCNR